MPYHCSGCSPSQLCLDLYLSFASVRWILPLRFQHSLNTCIYVVSLEDGNISRPESKKHLFLACSPVFLLEVTVGQLHIFGFASSAHTYEDSNDLKLLTWASSTEYSLVPVWSCVSVKFEKGIQTANQSSGSSSPTFIDSFPLDIALLIKKQGAEKRTWLELFYVLFADERNDILGIGSAEIMHATDRQQLWMRKWRTNE